MDFLCGLIDDHDSRKSREVTERTHIPAMIAFGGAEDGNAVFGFDLSPAYNSPNIQAYSTACANFVANANILREALDIMSEDLEDDPSKCLVQRQITLGVEDADLLYTGLKHGHILIIDHPDFAGDH
jgi:hypothetical protein